MREREPRLDGSLNERVAGALGEEPEVEVRWSSRYALLPCSRRCVQGVFSEEVRGLGVQRTSNITYAASGGHASLLGMDGGLWIPSWIAASLMAKMIAMGMMVTTGFAWASPLRTT